MNKPDRQVLEDAITLIENPKHWTRGALARDHDGNRSRITSPFTVAYCARGALLKATNITAETATTRQNRADQVARICTAITGTSVAKLALTSLGVPACYEFALTVLNDIGPGGHQDVILAMKCGLDNLS